MGFTPTSGLMMGTRSGDLDPSAVLFLMGERGYSVSRMRELLNHQSGLLGVSGVSSDMEELLRRAPQDSSAEEAIQLFSFQARRHLGALTAALGGVDTLVFTGGIGENAPRIRRLICKGLNHLGAHLDPYKNARNAPLISGRNSAVEVRIIPTNEEQAIARHAFRILSETGDRRL
jgi:acetate kinase